MINWPAIIHYQGDDELCYVASEFEWERNPEWSATDFTEADVLIDSVGRVYRMADLQEGNERLLATGQIISVNDLLNLVQRHAAMNNTCCVEKIGFRTIDEAMAVIASLVEQ
jgi:hypothetical protein